MADQPGLFDYVWIPTPDAKVCTYCHQPRPLNAFRRGRNTADRLHPWCKSCHLEVKRIRDSVSEEEYQRMLAAQGGRCAVCRCLPNRVKSQGRGRLDIDHDHSTGKIRGLLCRRCNVGAGHFKHDIRYMARMIDYLESYR